ncbi:ROK family protein [Nakamurella flavida]|uniref:ROK family protein n=1 Tax=Nakamurella flavida TaxID=363630 RepID=A0A938YKV8_9ACTN|nr:ROK family protein [Nakamurella flavida]MBM9475144.1 ROK family protein [Nakamurella flavida]MDP9776714.1 glucokinase [Nakamurella flavida]
MSGTEELLVAGVDVGGTNIEVGLVGDGHEVRARGKVATPDGGPEEVLTAIADLVRSMGAEPAAVGVGIPGVVHDGRVLTVPNLENWHEHVAVDSELADRLGVPVALGNDADVGLLGEWLDGAAKGATNALGVWMGTGIGGGLILDGRPYHGARGAAGELGHVIIRADGALCSCGRRGCVEAYAGRRSMARIASALVEAGRSTSLFDIQQDEGKPRLTSKVWARALDEGDEMAHELIDAAVAGIGLAVGSCLNLLDLELVVIGGGLAEKLGQPLADRIGSATRPWVLQPHPDLQFVVSTLGDDAGVVGAAALARASVIGH